MVRAAVKERITLNRLLMNYLLTGEETGTTVFFTFLWVFFFITFFTVGVAAAVVPWAKTNPEVEAKRTKAVTMANNFFMTSSLKNFISTTLIGRERR